MKPTPTTHPLPASLAQAVRQLYLSGLLQTLPLRLQEAQTHQLSHAEFLETLLQDELNIRTQRVIERRKKYAGFRDTKTLEDFDWNFNPTLPRKEVYQLATGDFIRKAQDVLWIGPPGIGKSHLVQAIGYHAIKSGFLVLYRSIFDLVRDLDQPQPLHDKILSKYLKPDLLIIDDMGMKNLPSKSGEHLFEIIMRRYENRSTMMTSNRPIEEWGKLIGDVPSATAILDRFLHHALVLSFKGKSFRLKDRLPKIKP